jgi:hypothetical protein
MMLLLSFFLAFAVCYPQGLRVGDFLAAQPGDARSPCPGLNALANHGFLNRNGRNIGGQDIIDAARLALSLSPRILEIAVLNAQTVDNIFPGGIMSGLDILNTTHDIIEHDASISRSDAYLGDFVSPNTTLINQFLPNLNANLSDSDIAAYRSQRIQVNNFPFVVFGGFYWIELI